MSKKSASTTGNQSKAKLGEQIRNIADRLKQETEMQIKATSRILGAASQISENHDRLINEVVDMVEEDLNQQTQTYKKYIYTVKNLKQKFKTFSEAKDHFKLKANSWELLANKLNDSYSQKLIPATQLYSSQDIEGDDIEKLGQTGNNSEDLAVYLDADVAEMFPNSQAVNEALRFLIRVTTKNSF
jgi:DNA repair ATPase RecN